MDEKSGSNVVDVGVDLSEFYMSVEWDILEVPAVRWVRYISKFLQFLPSVYSFVSKRTHISGPGVNQSWTLIK